MAKKCFDCGEKGADLYGHIVCDECKSSLGLFKDETIKKHIAKYAGSPSKPSYEEEIQERLEFLGKDYIKKRIKLLHVLDRLKQL